MMDTAAREAQRYAECLNTSDVDCLMDLAYPTPLSLITWKPGYIPPLPNQAALGNLSLATQPNVHAYWQIDVSVPAPIEADSDLLFALVPFRLQGYSRDWFDRRGYFVGVSANGEHWCFVEDTVVVDLGVEHVIPGYVGPDLPAVEWANIDAPRRARSEFLETRDAGFAVIGDQGEGYFEVSFKIRKRIRESTPLIIAFQNPENAEQALVIEDSLERKQDLLRMSSPRVSGLEAGATYSVIVQGFDPETEELLFQHRQPMLYRPVEGHDFERLPAISDRLENERRDPPWGFYPRDWMPDFETSPDRLCRASTRTGR